MKASRILIPALLLALSVSARAERVLDHYDLDSLAYLSDTIVRAQVGDSQPVSTADGNCIIYDIKVLATFKGGVKVDQTFHVAGLDPFHRAPGIAGTPDSWNLPQKGDQLYLFLVPVGKTGYAMYELTNADWTILESGARLLDNDHVYAFSQYSAEKFSTDPLKKPLRAPSGFVAMTNTTYPGAQILTQKAFEVALNESLQNAVQCTKLLAAELTPQTIGAGIKFLQARPAKLKAEMATSDALSEKLIQRLADTAPLDSLAALLPGSPFGTQTQIEYALQSSRGRAYLLDQVTDTHQSNEMRQEFAFILSRAGHSYAQDFNLQEQGKLTDLQSDFATRLAKLAADNLGTDVAAPLLTGVAGCSNGSFISNKALAADLHAAAKVLAEAFPKATPLDQFRIAETLMQIDRDAYHLLLPDAGNLLTLLEPSLDFTTALKSRTLHLMCRFRGQTAGFQTNHLTLVLHPTDGAPDIELLIDSKIGETPSTFGSSASFGSRPITATLPDSLAAGKYELFLRTSSGTRVQNNGLGFTTDLPPK